MGGKKKRGGGEFSPMTPSEVISSTYTFMALIAVVFALMLFVDTKNKSKKTKQK
jgi:hypothetical protein